jgi:hypothetical protein
VAARLDHLVAGSSKLSRDMLQHGLQAAAGLSKQQASTGLPAYLDGLATRAHPAEDMVLDLLADITDPESTYYQAFLVYEQNTEFAHRGVMHMFTEDKLAAPMLRLCCARADAGAKGVQVCTLRHSSPPKASLKSMCQGLTSKFRPQSMLVSKPWQACWVGLFS